MILSEEWKQTTAAFSSFLSALDNIRESVRQKQTEFEDLCTSLDNETEQPTQSQREKDKIVTLNVGGQKFQTSQETLTSVHESFFWCMLHSGGWKWNEGNGEHFIDRSPTVFPLILESLRQGEPVPTEHLSRFESAMLKNDVDFYGLKQFFGEVVTGPTLTWRCHTSVDGGVRFTENNQTAVFEPNTQFDSQTQIITEALKTMTANTTSCFRWNVTCTFPDLSGGDDDLPFLEEQDFYVVIMDEKLRTRQEYLCLEGSPSTVECEFNPRNNVVTLKCKAVTKRVDLVAKDISNPACAVEFSGGGMLPSAAEFQITTL